VPTEATAGDWLECSTLAEAEAVDAVAEVFGRLGQGVAIEEPIVSADDGEWVRIETDKPVLVKTYLPRDDQAEERRRQLEEAIYFLGRLRHVEPLRVTVIQERDWADAWKKHFFVHKVGQRLVIVPSWRRHRLQPDELAIRLDPGMAFGTGLHPTTRLCLRGLERYVRGGERVLDLGSGSGILAIAAGLLGAGSILGLDVEQIAVRVAQENVARNKLSRRIKLRHGSLPLNQPSEPFDLVVANISYRVLSELHPELRRALRPGGLALLSGVLERDAPALLSQLRAAGWQVLEEDYEAEWSLLVLAPQGEPAASGQPAASASVPPQASS
jgi:ribosomal protein L11 methyltransferase